MNTLRENFVNALTNLIEDVTEDHVIEQLSHPIQGWVAKEEMRTAIDNAMRLHEGMAPSHETTDLMSRIEDIESKLDKLDVKRETDRVESKARDYSLTESVTDLEEQVETLNKARNIDKAMVERMVRDAVSRLFAPIIDGSAIGHGPNA
jgi:hypothetical protein